MNDQEWELVLLDGKRMKSFAVAGWVVIGLTLASCGGSGSTPAVTAVHYSAPTAITLPTDIANINYVNIAGVSPSGHMVGTCANNSHGGSISGTYYWEAPMSAPVRLPTLGANEGIPVGVNDNKQIIGNIGSSAIEWMTPTSTPVTLPSPSGGGSNNVASINSNGQMVGSGFITNVGDVALVWNGPGAVQVLSYPDTGSVSASWITDSGNIYGSFLPPTISRPIAIGWTNRNSVGQKLATNTSLNLEGQVDFVSTTNNVALSSGLFTHDFSQGSGPLIWSSPSRASSLAFLGTTSGISSDGVICGTFDIRNPNTTTALVATSASSLAVDMNTLIPTGTGWTLHDANYMLRDGSIIGQGSILVGGVSTLTWFYARRL